MAIFFKSPEDCFEEFRTNLKSLKPDQNTDQEDSDWWIRGHVVGGVASGLYSDQRKIADDAFPQSARRDALDRHLFMYFNRTFNPATQGVGFARITGSIGSVVGVGLEFLYQPNGNTYQATSGFAMGATSALVPVLSVGSGQSQNLLEGAELLISSPPAGVNNTAFVADGPISDARNDETEAEAAQSILDRVRNPLKGGTASDYEQWAKDADPSVVSANVIRFPFGLGTVAVVISAGTTDIDAALDNGDAIVLTPSESLLEKVQDYIDARRPVTDCVTTIGTQEISIDVTVRVRLSQGDLGTILAGQSLTQQQLIQREVSRGLYKTPAGGRQFGSSGFVVASELEESLDIGLSAEPYVIGKTKMLLDRQISDLSATGVNRLLAGNQVPIPGTISVVEF